MTLNFMFFIVVILILVLALRGFHRGILGIIFGVAAWIFMIVFVQWASPQAYEHLKQDEKIVSVISQKVEETLLDKTKDITFENADKKLSEEKDSSLLDVLPKETVQEYEEMLSSLEEIRKTLSSIEDETLKKDLQAQASSSFNEKKEEVVLNMADIVTDYVLHGIATIISVVIGLIICGLVWLLIQVIHHTPVIGTASHLAGLFFGILEGIFLTWIIMYIISFSTLTQLGGSAMAQIRENEFLLYLYDNNILMNFFN